jgi:hypothetical protein
MIQPSLLAPWTKPPWHIGKLVKWTKQTGCRASYASDIRITPPAGRQFRFEHRLTSFEIDAKTRAHSQSFREIKQRSHWVLDEVLLECDAA